MKKLALLIATALTFSNGVQAEWLRTRHPLDGCTLHKTKKSDPYKTYYSDDACAQIALERFAATQSSDLVERLESADFVCSFGHHTNACKIAKKRVEDPHDDVRRYTRDPQLGVLERMYADPRSNTKTVGLNTLHPGRDLKGWVVLVEDAEGEYSYNRSTSAWTFDEKAALEKAGKATSAEISRLAASKPHIVGADYEATIYINHRSHEIGGYVSDTHCRRAAQKLLQWVYERAMALYYAAPQTSASCSLY